jgi:predicted nucleic acid-binding protein
VGAGLLNGKRNNEMNVFIDTNVFLSFYHLTSEDLEELEKLAVLLRQGKIVLWLPEQVRAELWRNRENKIFDALKRLRDQNLNLQFPALCKDYDEYDELRRYQRDYGREHAKLMQRVTEAVEAESLKADVTIRKLFARAKGIVIDEGILNRARLRRDVGNPPGKKGSLGDALNWESLLARVPEDETLHFVTGDKDYYSPIDDQRFDSFLMDEWTNDKGADLVPYKRLSSFFKAHFPDIRLAAELEKDLLIRDLAGSASFARTHAVIRKLRNHTDFTASQVDDIVAAANSNSQVYLIGQDADVAGFLTTVIAGHEKEIDPDNLAFLRRIMETNEHPTDVE